MKQGFLAQNRAPVRRGFNRVGGTQGKLHGLPAILQGWHRHDLHAGRAGQQHHIDAGAAHFLARVLRIGLADKLFALKPAGTDRLPVNRHASVRELVVLALHIHPLSGDIALTVHGGNLPRGQSFTPQMVIDGQDFTVGSNERKVSRAMQKADQANHSTVDVAVANQAGGKLSITLSGKTDKPAAVWLVRFKKAVTTCVRAGENKGKILTNHHIVTDIQRVAGWAGDVNALTTDAVTLKPGEGCAVLVQDDRQVPIRGVA